MKIIKLIVFYLTVFSICSSYSQKKTENNLNIKFSDSLYEKGIYYLKKNVDSSLFFLNKAYSIAKEEGSNEELYQIGNILASAYLFKYDFEKSLLILNDLISRIELDEPDFNEKLDELSFSKAQILNIYAQNFEKAEELLLYSIENSQDKLIKLRSYNALGWLKLQTNKIDTAYLCFNNEGYKKYFKKDLNKLSDNEWHVFLLNKFGLIDIYNRTNKLDLSQALIKQIEENGWVKKNDMLNISFELLKHQTIKHHNKQNCKNILELYRNLDTSNLGLSRHFYKELTMHFSGALQNKQARKMFFKRDSINRYIKNIQRTSTIKELSNELELRTKESQLKHSKLKNEKLIYQRKNGILIFITITITLIFIFFVLAFKSKNKSLKLEKESKQMEASLLDQELKILRSYIKGKDVIRKNVSFKLHDEIGTDLALVKLNLVNHNFDNTKILSKIDDLSTRIRNISHNLHRELSEDRFKELLLELVNNYSTENCKIVLSLYGFSSFSEFSEMLLNIYLIISEALVNIKKHSESNYVEVNLTNHDDYLNLYIGDNGKGIDKDKDSFQKGIGIKSIKERVKKMKGEIYLDSSNKGFIININIPN